MNKSCKLCWAVSLLLVVALGVGGYKFMVVGNVKAYADGRSSVLLLPNERNKVLGEMRGLLEGVQAITAAAVAGDMETVAQTASSLGMAAAEAESPAMIGKLPLEFKKLGFATHQAFDDLADFASSGAEPMEVLGVLSDVMLNCTACHAGYRIGLIGEKGE
jgi:hypothetical protein